MADIADLLKMGAENPQAFKAMLDNPEKMKAFNLSSADLATLKAMDPKALKVVAAGLESSMVAKGDSNACTKGTNACKKALDEVMEGISRPQ